MELAELVGAGHTAVLVSEMQRGVVGDLAPPSMAALAAEVQAQGVPSAVGRLLAAARAAGVPVVYCTVHFRPDRIGTPIVTPLMAVTLRDPGYLAIGSASAEILTDLAPEHSDLISARTHGMTPFADANLDVLLRDLGVRTVVLCGVSLNVALIGSSVEAVNRGYRVAVARDAAAGVPTEYGEALLRSSLAPLATVTTVEQLAAAWAPGPE
jgi:nicotinamidase-related amidase